MTNAIQHERETYIKFALLRDVLYDDEISIKIMIALNCRTYSTITRTTLFLLQRDCDDDDYIATFELMRDEHVMQHTNITRVDICDITFENIREYFSTCVDMSRIDIFYDRDQYVCIAFTCENNTRVVLRYHDDNTIFNALNR